MTSNIGRAIAALETGLAAAVQDGPMAWRFGRALGAMEVARDLLLRIDPADVAKWLDNEQCQRCGSVDADVFVEVARRATPLCARCATVTEQEQCDERAENGEATE